VTSMGAGTRKLCVAYDVEHYSQRGTRREYATQQRLSDVLAFAFSEVNLTPAEYVLQEQGDGGLALLPTGGAVDEPRLIVGLLRALRHALTELNEDLVEPARIRLRVALHEGIVHRAAHGYVGPAVIEVCRLRDADPVRNALAGSNAVLVAVVADGLYRDVLSHGYHGLPGSATGPERGLDLLAAYGWDDLFAQRFAPFSRHADDVEAGNRALRLRLEAGRREAGESNPGFEFNSRLGRTGCRLRPYSRRNRKSHSRL